jgi:hypothetical protein
MSGLLHWRSACADAGVPPVSPPAHPPGSAAPRPMLTHLQAPHTLRALPCPQRAVEQGLGNVSSGVALNPLWYPKYWLGLSTVDDWPYYSWDDGVTPGPDYPSNNKYYKHWGNYENTAVEPNDGALCAVADFLEAYSITKVSQSSPSLGDADLAWGWNDVACNLTFPYICQYPPQREWPCASYWDEAAELWRAG